MTVNNKRFLFQVSSKPEFSNTLPVGRIWTARTFCAPEMFFGNFQAVNILTEKSFSPVFKNAQPENEHV